ncbi:MAG: phosphotransferase, partial [Anaerolineales bacterium]
MGEDFSSELIMILEMYDLGELVDFQRDVRGTVNTSFTIEMLKDGARRKYFLRRYKDGIRSDEVRCEHSMIRRLKSQGFDIVAGAMPTRDGGTYVLVKEETDGQNGVFYAVFDFLTGEDRYTWVGPVCSPAEIASSASVLAEFHQALSGFVPEGSRMEPGILQLLPQIEANLRACAARARAAGRGSAGG